LPDFAPLPSCWELEDAAILFVLPAPIGSGALWTQTYNRRYVFEGEQDFAYRSGLVRRGKSADPYASPMMHLDKPILFLATADAKKSRAFYEEALGLTFVADEPPALVFRAGESMLRIQKVERVQCAPYTALGWAVPDIRKTVQHLRRAGVVFLRYEGMNQDADNIWHAPSGAFVAWFQDPDGNTLSLTQFK
jgi:catechol 2,3-dioxygenase-like lactoylglutathione lyase family enzyme